jgi:hypothetical protein
VLKVRLQMQNELGAAAAAGRQAAGPAAAAAAAAQPPQLGLLQMLKKIVKAEGPAALMYGWQVGCGAADVKGGFIGAWLQTLQQQQQQQQ